MRLPVTYTAIIIASIHFAVSSSSDNKPHIIFILADDLGWNDVSLNGSPQIPTPNIDALAASGIVLHDYYTAPLCTPSRGSFLTGLHPVNIGLQHFIISNGEPRGLDLNFTLLPQHLKKLGYSTSMIGKWHLGYYKKEYTPIYRGFDNFFGYMSGYIDYFDYTFYSNKEGNEFWGVDMYDGSDIVKNYRGKYATDLFADKAIKVIENHNATKPLFLYLSSLAPHIGNPYAPLQALPEDVAKFKHIKDVNRRKYAAMVSRLDESIGRVFESLWAKGMLNNSIIVFCSDNGATSTDSHGSNWPLRGQKMTLWEGGVRVPAIIWSPLLKLEEPLTSDKLMHVSDWLPTLYHAAGGDIEDLGTIDGINIWPHLTDHTLSPRTGVLLNIDPVESRSAIRYGDYKLIQGAYTGKRSQWLGTSGRDDIFLPSSLDEWVWKNGSVVKRILETANLWIAKGDDSWRANLTVNCGADFIIHEHPCDMSNGHCLFNIVRDPCEYNDLSLRFPKIVRRMKELIQNFENTALPSVTKSIDPKANPLCHGFAHVPWMDEEHQSNCPYLD